MSAPIVVGVDGSASALAATGWAAREAARHRVPLRLVHAYLLPPTGYPELVVNGPEVRQAFEQQGRQWVQDAAVAARAAVPDVRVETAVVVDHPAAALVAASREARQVVLGSRGLGGFTGLLVGSVAVAVSAHGACPVVVVRAEGVGDGPVVVGVDGSPASEEAIDFAFEEASLRGAPLTAVIAWNDFLVDSAYHSRFTVDWAEVEQEQLRVLAERLAGRQEKYPDVRVHRAVVHDRPVRALLALAERARLLVVGSHGRGGFTGMLLGSTSQALVRHAPCPLAVVRPDAAGA
ncbi:universal stress protein [Saccharothrix algeriensis]|uniref:Nucleotide-binding universal stress UspA family protein n=1 Tax=Saccharothrix algeriensis TaxID=173560 RepID=A0A8T8I032_9PSEU|nr:universal stress protein [Saccharothrix algeriensis]MBM7809705.1 nucleotide-binding universal stress UspA family protein [Saccharothrix algeriensis]QTR03999.1 universal stress protein [Saccharothrix algeriensis]